MGNDVVFSVTERGGQLLVDLFFRPLVLATVAAGERALHLAEHRAGHERNGLRPVAELAHHELVVRDHLPVERGLPEFLGRGPQRRRPGRDQRCVRHRLQLVDLIAREIQVLERMRRDRLLRLDALGWIRRAVRVVTAALRRDFVEEAFRGLHVHHTDDFAAAARLPEDHDVAGIAAEVLDVVVNPLQRHEQICRAGVARLRVLLPIRRQIERTQDVQPVIDADDHDVAELAEAAAVVGVRLYGGAVREPAAVHPDHDRLLRRHGEALGPDIQVLAMLVLYPVTMGEHEFVGAHRGLRGNRADRAPHLRVLDARPRLGRLGWSKPFGFCVAGCRGTRTSCPPAGRGAFRL